MEDELHQKSLTLYNLKLKNAAALLHKRKEDALITEKCDCAGDLAVTVNEDKKTQQRLLEGLLGTVELTVIESSAGTESTQVRLVKRSELNVAVDEEAFTSKRGELRGRIEAVSKKNEQRIEEAQKNLSAQMSSEALTEELSLGLTNLENEVKVAAAQGREIAQKLQGAKSTALDRQAALRLELDELSAQLSVSEARKVHFE